MKRCYLCGVESSGNNMTREHFIPKSHGGSNSASNIFPACSRCNKLKADKMPTFVNLMGVHCTVLLRDVLKLQSNSPITFIQDNIEVNYSSFRGVEFNSVDLRIYKSSTFSKIMVELIKKLNIISYSDLLDECVHHCVEDAFFYYITLVVGGEHISFPESMAHNIEVLKVLGRNNNERF